MKNYLRFLFVAFLAMQGMNAMASDWVIDFNKMTVATSSSDSQDGDINETTTFWDETKTVKIEVSPKDESATTANRFWGTSNGPQLRMYSGSITITTTGAALKTIVFNNGKWNTGNTASVGSLAEGKWTFAAGASSVVITIAGNTQLNNITFSTEASEPEEEVHIANTPETAYTVEQCVDIIQAGKALSEKVYVKGFITDIDEVSVEYGNATFKIATKKGDKDAEYKLKIYRSKYFDNQRFSEQDQIAIDDEVILYGQLQLYNGEGEMTNGYLYARNGETSSIHLIQMAEQADKIYNTAGQKLSAPQKGLNIIDGRKVMVK